MIAIVKSANQSSLKKSKLKSSKIMLLDYLSIFSTFFIVLFSSFLLSFIISFFFRHSPSLSTYNTKIYFYLISPFHINLDFLTILEKSHMGDVKLILVLLFFIFLPVLIFSIWYFKKNPYKLKPFLRMSSLIALSIESILAITILSLGFDRFWTLFHHILFPGGNWQFPLDSTLIILYSSDFFISFILLFAGIYLILNLFLFIYFRKNTSNYIKT
jgi:uncharacterized membrane protein